MKRLAALIVLLLTAGGPLSARDFFLDAKSGNDAAEASRDHPWRTIPRANTNDFAPGDRLLFHGGQTFPGNLALDAHDAGTVERPVTIDSCFLIYSYAGSPGFHRRNIIRFNVSIDDARLKSYGGITLGNDGGRFNGVEILHNTVVNSGDGRSTVRLVGGGSARGVHFSGNLFHARNGALLMAGDAQPELTFRGNAWCSAGAPARFQWAGTEHAALADWRAAAKMEAGEPADIEADPRIVLPEQAPAYAEDFARTKRPDFRPTASSPFRHAIRMNANAGPNDFSGTPLSSAGEPGTIGALQNAAE